MQLFGGKALLVCCSGAKKNVDLPYLRVVLKVDPAGFQVTVMVDRPAFFCESSVMFLTSPVIAS